MIGGALLLGAAGYYSHERLHVASVYAIVAAPAQELSAPTDGVATRLVSLHEVAEPGTPLAEVKRSVEHDPELRAIHAELAANRAEAASLDAFYTVGEKLQSQVRNREATLKRQRVEHLKHVSEQAKAEVATSQVDLQAATLAAERAEGLCEEGLMSAADCEAARFEKARIERQLNKAIGRLTLEDFLRQSSQLGLDVGGEVTSDLTAARQQSIALRMQTANLKQRIDVTEASHRALERRLQVPPATLTAGARTRVWAVFTPRSAFVTKGQTLLQVAACDELFVLAVVDLEEYQDLRVGDEAVVKIAEHSYPGKVAQLLGPVTSALHRTTLPAAPAFATTRVEAKRQAIAIHSPQVAEAMKKNCGVGTAVEVTFAGPRVSMARFL